MRKAFREDEEAAFAAADLSDEERDLIRRRDWIGMIRYGVIFFMLEKLGAVTGVGNIHIYAAMKGLSVEDFQKTRNAPGALYSVAGRDRRDLAWTPRPTRRGPEPRHRFQEIAITTTGGDPMKHTFCAVALACLAATGAHAQVTMYGNLDIPVEYLTNAPAGSLLRLPGLTGSVPSRLGFRGTEDLGGGLRAVFTMEMGISADNGSLNQGGRAFGRQALVGVGGPWGTVSLGGSTRCCSGRNSMPTSWGPTCSARRRSTTTCRTRAWTTRSPGAARSAASTSAPPTAPAVTR